MFKSNLQCRKGHKWYAPKQRVKLPVSNECQVAPKFFVGKRCGATIVDKNGNRRSCGSKLQLIGRSR